MEDKEKKITLGEIGDLLKAYAGQEERKAHSRAGLALFEGGSGEDGMLLTWGDSRSALAREIATAIGDFDGFASIIVEAVLIAVKNGTLEGAVLRGSGQRPVSGKVS